MTVSWRERPEAGGQFALRVARWLIFTLGRTRVLWLSWPVALYFMLRRGPERRASRQFLTRALALPVYLRLCHILQILAPPKPACQLLRMLLITPLILVECPSYSTKYQPVTVHYRSTTKDCSRVYQLCRLHIYQSKLYCRLLYPLKYLLNR